MLIQRNHQLAHFSSPDFSELSHQNVSGYSPTFFKYFNDINKRVFLSHHLNQFPLTEGQKKSFATPLKFYNSFFKGNSFRSIRGKIDNLDSIVFNSGIFNMEEHGAWIYGAVGMGKTSTLCKWFLDRQKKLIQDRRIVLRMDIDEACDTPNNIDIKVADLDSEWEFSKLIVRKIKLGMIVFRGESGYKTSISAVNEIEKTETDPVLVVERSLRTIFEKMGIKVTIVIDNLDFIVYTGTRYTHIDYNYHTEVERHVAKYFAIFQDLLYYSIEGFSFIVVSRQSSGFWLKRKDIVDRKLNIANDFLIESTIDSKGVILAHYELLDSINRERVGDNKDKVEMIITEAINAINGYTIDEYNKDIPERAVDLAGDGLRGVMSLGKLLLLTHTQESFRLRNHEAYVVARRLTQVKDFLEMCLILQDRSLYSRVSYILGFLIRKALRINL